MHMLGSVDVHNRGGWLQVRVFRSVMAKMPPTLLQRGPSLHALASEIAMWLVVHHLSDRSADVLTPLCSAVLDCFAGDAKAMRLEQPAALLDDHMCAPAPPCTHRTVSKDQVL